MQTRLNDLGMTRVHIQFVGINDYASCSPYGIDSVQGLEQLLASWGVTFDHADATSS